MTSFPFADVLAQSNELIEKRGATVYQKFECDGCLGILTMSDPNTFYTSGSCDKCGHVTDIKKKGCNTMVVFGAIDVKKAIGEA